MINWRPYFSSTIFSTNVLFSLLQPNEVAFSFFLPNLIHGLITFEKYWPIILETVPQNCPGFVRCFLMTEQRLWIFSKTTTEVVWYVLPHTSSHHEVHDADVLLFYIGFDHLVNVVSTGFLYYKVIIFPFITSKYLREKLWDYENPISPQISTTNFRIH